MYFDHTFSLPYPPSLHYQPNFMFLFSLNKIKPKKQK